MSARVPAVVALVAAVALGGAAWRWRTGAVGGSDSACYALMTKAYVEGRWQPVSALAGTAPWPEPTRVAAPGGFLPSQLVAGAAVPVCAPGYGLLLAPMVWLGGLGVIHVVPAAAGAVLVWLAFVLGRRLHSPWAGSGAALLVGTSPIVLFQAVQPMNDITTAAIWTAVAAAALAPRPVTVGLLAGIGLLVRPNLAPAAVVAVLVVGLQASRRSDAMRALRDMTVASLSAAPGVAVALALNRSLYGSPFTSGYGDLGGLFAVAHVPVNLVAYGATWLAVGTPLVLAAVAAPFVLAAERRGEAWMMIALAGALSVVYLAYRPFPEWWYLRFLLPAVTLSFVLATAAIAAAVEGRGVVGRGLAALVIVGAAAVLLRSPEAAVARRLARLEARFPMTSEVVATRLPAASVLVTGFSSGAVQFAPGREVVMWDALDPAWLDRAVRWLDQQGRPPAIVLEAWEQEAFRARFSGQTYGALDWPPRYDLGRRVLVFLPEDRDRYHRDETVATETIFDRRFPPRP